MDLNSLPPVENLLATRSQIEKDLSLLSESFAQLKAAGQNFATSMRLLSEDKEAGDEAVVASEPSALVPLTASVYVDAKLMDRSRVMIDVGTGYFIEQPLKDAKEYYERKVAFINGQLESLQPSIQEKRSMISVLSQVISQKLQSQK